jgi:hypothetical protein
MIRTVPYTSQLAPIVGDMIAKRAHINKFQDPIVPNRSRVNLVYKNGIFVGITFYYTHLASNNVSTAFYMPKDVDMKTEVKRFP